MDLIVVASHFAIGSLHQEELEVIRRTQILGHARLADSFLPEHRTDLATQPIPALLVIVHNRPEKIPFQLLKGHGPSAGARLEIMDAMTRIGQPPLEALRHPAKDGFNGAFREMGNTAALVR